MQVTFVDSVQGHQTGRVREIAQRLRKARPELGVTVVEGEDARAMLKHHKLNFGPAVVVDGLLEYVGVPRWRFLQERLAQVAAGVPNPRSSVPPTPPPKPATPAAAPAGEKKPPSPGATG
ncbi:MAG: hypothetical protein AABY30_05050 [Candidatus Thermoplasmatota archaeon]